MCISVFSELMFACVLGERIDEMSFFSTSEFGWRLLALKKIQCTKGSRCSRLDNGSGPDQAGR